MYHNINHPGTSITKCQMVPSPCLHYICLSSPLCFHIVPLLPCHLLSVSAVLSPPLLHHLWMISRVRWKQVEDTQPALHIHLSFCSLHSPGLLCLLSLHPFYVPAVILYPKHLHDLSSVFSVPCCSVSLSSTPLHPRWTKWTLCSKINFEKNEAMVSWTCSMIFCQKCSEGYVLIYLLSRHSTFVTCSFLSLCSGVYKQTILFSAKNKFPFKYSQRGKSRAD